ncbi:hypothetical protein AMAG_18762 [Allomyces macrogynus ATCC 38327]|uniref:Uncharacterized protein n=1 Tax=Allomyces macrogynus (strain ATCC 38327) TaxID=578462 RepID=A0A0L0SFK6_ALLM3|nr:hypothetical protein AMAG_18762 [Allomyces macrogynus ATCC 38327]|eukprot:KNE61281.1 hypothetical protein AMAG_18762 [Allomyces macrogynus ATCC 38327]
MAQWRFAVFWDVEHPVEYFVHRATGVAWAKLEWAFPGHFRETALEDPEKYWFQITLWANVPGKRWKDMEEADVDYQHFDLRKAFLTHLRSSSKSRSHQLLAQNGSIDFGYIGSYFTSVPIMDGMQVVNMVDYAIRRVFQVMASLCQEYGESTLEYATGLAQRHPGACGYGAFREEFWRMCTRLHVAPFLMREWWRRLASRIVLQRLSIFSTSLNSCLGSSK